jgi:hypothetical protein
MKTQEYTADRTGLDLKHYNSVINTVTQIADETVKKYKIRQIKIEGARDEYDSNNYFNPTLRAKLYLRQILRIYPSDAVISFGKNIKIDMTKVYPELFDDLTKLNTIINLIVQISDESDITNDFTETSDYIGGINDNDFDINHANVFNSKLGELSIAVVVDSKLKQYSIEWRSYDTDEEQSEYFNNFKSLVNYIKEMFLTPKEKTPLEIPEEELIGTKALVAVGNKLRAIGYDVKAMIANNQQQLITDVPQQDNTVYLIHMEDDEEYKIYFMVNDLKYRVIYDKEEKTYWLNIFENIEQRDDEIESKYYQSIEELLKDIK